MKNQEAKTVEQPIETELYEGMVVLTIASPVDCEQIKKLEESLSQVENLRVVLVGGSVEEGNKIVISAKKPTPLLSVLNEVVSVEEAVKNSKDIRVKLAAKREAVMV